jgi:hypothetical protein
MRGLKRPVNFLACRFKAMGMTGLAVTGSLAGIAILYLIVNSGSPPLVALDDAWMFEGKQIQVEGAVIDQEPLEGAGYSIMIYQNGTTLKISVEDTESRDMPLHRWVRASGEVISYYGNTELEVIAWKDIEEQQDWTPKSGAPSNIGDIKGRYVSVNGSISNIRVWDTGFTRIEMFDGEGTCTVTSKDDPFQYQTGRVLGLGDTIQVCGLAANDSWGPSLEILDPRAVKYLGAWIPRDLEMGDISLEIMSLATELERTSPGFLDEWDCFPINITGYVKYQPMYPGSLILAEAPEGGIQSLKVSFEECGNVSMGDLVRVTGTLGYDPGSLRFSIDAQSLDMLVQHGPMNPDMASLAESPSTYHGARIRLSGVFLGVSEKEEWLLGDGQEDPQVVVRAEWGDCAESEPPLYSEIEIEGRWMFDPVELVYFLSAGD